MRKLIEISQEYIVVCDNPKCDFKVLNELPYSEYGLSFFINKPCSDCGDNLLTAEDYLQAENMMKVVGWLNKWFSWVTIFYGKNIKRTEVHIHCHDGIKITKKGE